MRYTKGYIKKMKKRNSELSKGETKCPPLLSRLLEASKRRIREGEGVSEIPTYHSTRKNGFSDFTTKPTNYYNLYLDKLLRENNEIDNIIKD